MLLSFDCEPADQQSCRSPLQVHRGSYTQQSTSSLAQALLRPAMGNAQSSAIFDAASKDDLARLQEIVRREHIDLGSSDKVWGGFLNHLHADARAHLLTA